MSLRWSQRILLGETKSGNYSPENEEECLRRSIYDVLIASLELVGNIIGNPVVESSLSDALLSIVSSCFFIAGVTGINLEQLMESNIVSLEMRRIEKNEAAPTTKTDTGLYTIS